MKKKYLKEVIYNQLLERITKKTEKKIRITAIIAAFNEEDIIGHVLEHFISKGIKVYFIDHHSTDNTLEQAKKFKGKGVIGIETFPEESGYPSNFKDIYAWRYILKRKEELHKILGADWYLHMDADAIVESPWEDVPISAAIQLVDALGYNCINFELFNFRPVTDKYKGDIKPQDFFKYWEPADSFDELQIKCWKNFGQKIDLVSSGGHNVQFKEKKVFPIKFIMRHYPIRSKVHGVEKIFSERLPRLDIKERRKGWHRQYNQYLDGKDIEFNKKNLLNYDDKIVKEVYLPLISCFNILDEKNRVIKDKEQQIRSIYSSRTWKVGRIAIAPWRFIKGIFKKF